MITGEKKMSSFRKIFIPLATILIALFPSLQKPQVRLEARDSAVVAYAACCREAGTTWSVSLDNGGVVNVTSEYISDSSSPCAVIGIGGYDVFTFTAAGEGKTTATLKYSGKRKTAEEKFTLYSRNGKVTTVEQTDPTPEPSTEPSTEPTTDVEKTPVSITATAKGKVYSDAKIDKTNFNVFVNYSDGTKAAIKDFTVTGKPSVLSYSSYTVKATVGGKEFSTGVTVNYLRFTSVTAEAKSELHIGKNNFVTVDDSAFTATVTYEDGSVRTGRSFEPSAAEKVTSPTDGYIYSLTYTEAGAVKPNVKGTVNIVSDTEFVKITASPRKYFVPGNTLTSADFICKAYRENDTAGVEVTSFTVSDITFTEEDIGKEKTVIVTLLDCGKYFTAVTKVKCIAPYDVVSFNAKMKTMIIHVGDEITADMFDFDIVWSDGIERDISDDVTVHALTPTYAGTLLVWIDYVHNGKQFNKSFTCLVAEKDCPLDYSVRLKSLCYAVGDTIGENDILISATLRKNSAEPNEYSIGSGDFDISFDSFTCTEKGNFALTVSYPAANGVRKTESLPFSVIADKRTTFALSEDGKIVDITDGDGKTIFVPSKINNISVDVQNTNWSALLTAHPEYKTVYFESASVPSINKLLFDDVWVNANYPTSVSENKNTINIGTRIHYRNTFESSDGKFTLTTNGNIIRYNVLEKEDVTVLEAVNGVEVKGITRSAFANRKAAKLTICGTPEIGQYAFSSFVADEIDLGGVTSLASHALSFLTVEKLTASNVKTVEKEALSRLNVTEFDFSALETVKEHAFDSFKTPSDIVLPSVVKIEANAFFLAETSGTIVLPSIKEIASDAFVKSDFTAIKLPNTDIGTIAGAKWGAASAQVYYRNSSSGIQYIVDGDGNATVLGYIQTDTPITKLVIPSAVDGHTVTGLGDGRNVGIFDGITEMVLPDTVTFIADNTLSNNTTLEKISGAGITDIGSSAFAYSTKLATAYFPSAKQIGDYAFIECSSLTGIGEAKPLTVGEYSFKESGITYIDLSECTRIGNSAFTFCSKLTDIVSIRNATSLGEDVFVSAISLGGEIVFNDAIKDIPYFLFTRTKITKVTVPSDLKSVGVSAFNGCTQLESFAPADSDKSFVLPDTVEKICVAAFNSCVKLTGDLIIPEKVRAVETHTFYDCNFKSLTLHDGITFIGAEAFARNYGMTGILTLPAHLEYLGDKAFDHDYMFENTSLYIPASLLTIGGDLVRPSYFESRHEPARNSTHMFYNFASQTFKEYIVDENNPNYKSIDGVLFSKDGKRLIGFPCAKTVPNGVYTVPDGVVEFDDMCFSRAGIGGGNLSVLVLPDTYTVADNLGHKNCVSWALKSYNTLSASLYYTGVKELRVNDTNPSYTCVDGVLYSKDMTTLVCVPPRYEGRLVIPEGVTRAVKGAIGGSDVNDDATMVSALKGRVTEIVIPSTLTDIFHNVRFMGINKSGATITVAEGNSVYCVKDGLLEFK